MSPLHLSIGLLVVLALVVIAYFRRKSRAGVPAQRPNPRHASDTPATSATRSSPYESPSGLSVADVALPAPLLDMPLELLDFQWHTAESLSEMRRELMWAGLKGIQPPPRALHQLVSQDFVARASSTELAELVIGVPLVAAKVLARANSAFYGLPQPVSSVGQAITFLGLNAVRAIALQYMMESSFKAHTPEVRRRFDEIWAASAIAGDLSQKLAQRLRVPDAGSLVTEVALSSLGHLATATLMSPEAVAAPVQGFLTHTRSEQTRLGVPAAEVGALLMRAWALPDALVEEVRAIDRMLVTPPGTLEPERHLRVGVAYLCARLGDRVARGEAVDLNDFEQGVALGNDYHCLLAGMQPAQLQRVKEALRAPEVARSLQTMLAALKAPAASNH